MVPAYYCDAQTNSYDMTNKITVTAFRVCTSHASEFWITSCSCRRMVFQPMWSLIIAFNIQGPLPTWVTSCPPARRERLCFKYQQTLPSSRLETRNKTLTYPVLQLIMIDTIYVVRHGMGTSSSIGWLTSSTLTASVAQATV